MQRKILHLDLDAFFCAVEELQNPALRGKAFAVGGRPDQRGVVSSCSYAARMLGIRSAMPMALAVRRCPGLIVLPARHRLYADYSEQVMARLAQFTPLLEQISIDEAFLDLSDLPDPPEHLARQLQAAVHAIGLPCSLGAAGNKLVAKIATEVGKHAARGPNPPNAITVVPAGQEAEFLRPLPADMLWGVGPKTAARLAELGIHTIGQIADREEGELMRLFGEHGRELSRRARGLDDRPVVTAHEVKSISQETTFARDVSDDRALERTLRELSGQVGRRLRAEGLAGTTVRIKLRWPDFTTLTRQVRLSAPVDQDDQIVEAARALLRKARTPGRAVRLLGVGVSGLGPPVRQLSLWDQDGEKARRLQSALDELRERFGDSIIKKG